MFPFDDVIMHNFIKEAIDDIAVLVSHLEDSRNVVRYIVRNIGVILRALPMVPEFLSSTSTWICFAVFFSAEITVDVGVTLRNVGKIWAL